MKLCLCPLCSCENWELTPMQVFRTINTALLASGAERKPGLLPRGALERAVERVLTKEQKQ